MRTCPNCSKSIQDDTVKCPYCGEATNNNDDEVNKLIQQMENKSSKSIFSRIADAFATFLFGVGVVFKFIIIAAIVVCVICFIGYFIFG